MNLIVNIIENLGEYNYEWYYKSVWYWYRCYRKWNWWKTRGNILNLFNELGKETHLITNCYLNQGVDDYKESPIYYFNECDGKDQFNYKQIAEDLLRAECKTDNTRNSTIREGLLFIKANSSSIIIMKLEKLTVIDKATYEIKSELGKEKDYFKVCTFKENTLT